MRWIGDLVIVYIKRLDNKESEMKIEVYFPDFINLECITHQLGH